MKRMRGKRQQAAVAGLLLCLPVALLSTVPASAWRFAGDQLSTDRTERWTVQAKAPRVAVVAPVRITGTIPGALSPGVSLPIHLRFSNTNRHTVTLGRVLVTVTGISAPRADAAHPCTRGDFRIRQMRPRTLQVPARRTTDLVSLAVPARSWPRLKMRSLPVNQDGCQGARLTLSYQAHGVRTP